MIKAKPIPFKWLVFLFKFVELIFKRKFNKIVIHPISTISHQCSYVFMVNHFSFLDGFIAGYLIKKELIEKGFDIKQLYIMSLDKQLQKNRWITRLGGFSVSHDKNNIRESLEYAASLLNTPGNVLMFFPQGKIESNHATQLILKKGIANIIPKVQGKCQLLWSSNLIDYYEGIKPSVYCHLLDCGTNQHFDFAEFTEKVNTHHQLSIQKQIRFPLKSQDN